MQAVILFGMACALTDSEYSSVLIGVRGALGGYLLAGPNIDLGVFLVPSRVPQTGRELVLGQNNQVFMAGDHTISAIDPNGGNQLWTFQTALDGGVQLLAATSDGGLLAATLTSDIDPNNPVESLATFDVNGSPSLTPAGRTITNASYTDINLLFATTSAGQGQALPPAVVKEVATDDFTFAPGNAAVQRAPTPPQITYDKQIVKTGIFQIGKDVRGAITVTIRPKSASSKITFHSTNNARHVSLHGPAPFDPYRNVS